MKIQVIPTINPDVKLVETVRHIDKRGFFEEIFVKNWFFENVAPVDFVQENLSFSKEKHTLRGLHYQIKPYEQDKFVSVLSGSILDVAVDIRPNSKFFGKHIKIKISSTDSKHIFIPKGFAHGYLTLEANTTILYKVSNYYNVESERGIIWNDPKIGIDWEVLTPNISEKDSSYKDITGAKL